MITLTEVTVTEATALSAPPVRVRVLVMLVMQCLVVLACVLSTAVIASRVQEHSIRSATEERVLDVALSLADLDQVREGVLLPTDEAIADLQPLADIIQEASGVDYVVVTDAEGVRVTHPTPSERGRMVSTDPSDILAGETFVGTESGTLGPTLRAKVPVIVDGDVRGTASVGILESEIAADFDDALAALVPWVFGSIVVGCIASAGLTSLVRRRVRRLERDARELEFQRRVSAAMRDQTHEFRTRLHVIHGLVAEGDSADALAYIDGLAPVSRDGGAGADIADAAARGVLSGIAEALASAGGRLRVDPLSTVPKGVLADDDIMILGNLCRNAVEAVAAAGEVEVLLRAEERTVLIDVSDDGPGIAPGETERIFQRGFSSKAVGGHQRGVGLDLVRRAVRRRGGTIVVERSESGGARFIVDMPTAARR